MVKVALIGFGTVAQTIHRELTKKRACVVGVFTKKFVPHDSTVKIFIFIFLCDRGPLIITLFFFQEEVFW